MLAAGRLRRTKTRGVDVQASATNQHGSIYFGSGRRYEFFIQYIILPGGIVRVLLHVNVLSI